MFCRRKGLTVVRNLAPRLLRERRPVWIMKKPMIAAAAIVIPVTVSRPLGVGASLATSFTMRKPMMATRASVVPSVRNDRPKRGSCVPV